MKLAFAISYQKTSFDAVGSGDFENSLLTMSDYGYNGVEIALRNPELIKLSTFEAILNRYNLELAALGTGQAYVDEGISLMDPDHAIRNEAVNRIKKHIDLASVFDCQVIIGLIRGKILDKNNEEKQVYFFKTGVTDLCTYAEKKKVTLTIEPLNRYECNFLNKADEAAEFIDQINSTNLKILLDTFHMNIEEKNLSDTIIKNRKNISHIHIADSNRKYPGMGHIDFIEICRTLRKINYKGFISGEMLPFPSLEKAMKQYIDKMKEVING